jgi:hypothetical protein
LFSTSAPAFTGMATVDFSSLVALLPGPGASGQILAGWSETPGQILGEWAVVPEVAPAAQAGVMGLAVLGFAAVRRGWRARPGA